MAYTRSQREPGYFETDDSQYMAESSRQTASSNLRQSKHDNMTSAPDRAEPSSPEVSPELIAAITERVKREGTSIIS